MLVGSGKTTGSFDKNLNFYFCIFLIKNNFINIKIYLQ